MSRRSSRARRYRQIDPLPAPSPHSGVRSESRVARGERELRSQRSTAATNRHAAASVGGQPARRHIERQFCTPTGLQEIAQGWRPTGAYPGASCRRSTNPEGVLHGVGGVQPLQGWASLGPVSQGARPSRDPGLSPSTPSVYRVFSALRQFAQRAQSCDVRHPVADLCEAKTFGTPMKREATARRFFEAALQAFLGDGLPWNWSIWKKQFPTFTPI